MLQEIRRHNETVLETLEEGDMVELNRGMISHWGIYGGMYQIFTNVLCPVA